MTVRRQKKDGDVFLTDIASSMKISRFTVQRWLKAMRAPIWNVWNKSTKAYNLATNLEWSKRVKGAYKTRKKMRVSK